MSRSPSISCKPSRTRGPYTSRPWELHSWPLRARSSNSGNGGLVLPNSPDRSTRRAAAGGVLNPTEILLSLGGVSGAVCHGLICRAAGGGGNGGEHLKPGVSAFRGKERRFENDLGVVGREAV